MKLGVTNPILAGNIRGSFNASSIANTDWNDLSSSDFLDPTTGSAVAAGLQFAKIIFVNKGTGLAYVKYRARILAGDPTTNEIPIDYSLEDDVGTLQTPVSTIAYKKNAAGDTFYVLAGFTS